MESPTLRRTAPYVVAFDYDGVIADSLDYFRQTFLDVCGERGYRHICSDDDFLAIFDTNMYEGMVKAGIPRGEIRETLVQMARRLDEHGHKYRIFDRVADSLERLAHRATLYVVTSNVGAVVSIDLARAGISCFREVLGSEVDTSKHAKLELLKQRHPGATLYYVGDTVGDMVEGRKAGAGTVAVTWGFHGRSRLLTACPDVVLDTPEQLGGLVDER